MGNNGESLLALDKSCPASDGRPHVAVKTMPGICLYINILFILYVYIYIYRKECIIPFKKVL